jgi:hypothetical protein
MMPLRGRSVHSPGIALHDYPVLAIWQTYRDERGELTVNSPDEAVELVLRLDADPSVGRVLVEFVSAEGASLTVAVGAEFSVLCFQTNIDPPYFWTVSDTDGLPELLDFSYGGSMSEYEGRQLVTKAAARADDAATRQIRSFLALLGQWVSTSGAGGLALDARSSRYWCRATKPGEGQRQG